MSKPTRRSPERKLQVPLSCCGGKVSAAEVVNQDLRLVDGEQGSTVVDPHEVCILEVFGWSFGVGGGHELVVSCPDDEDRPSEGALLIGPLEQLLRLGDAAEVLGEVAADLGVVAQRMDPVPGDAVENPPLRQCGRPPAEARSAFSAIADPPPRIEGEWRGYWESEDCVRRETAVQRGLAETAHPPRIER